MLDSGGEPAGAAMSLREASNYAIEQIRHVRSNLAEPVTS